MPELLKVHDVVIYTVEDAKTRRLSLLLPASTPETLTIRGLDGVSVKDFRQRNGGVDAALERAAGRGPAGRDPPGGRF